MSSSSSSSAAAAGATQPSLGILAAESDPPFFGKEDPGAKAVVQKLFPDIAENLARAAGRGKTLNWRRVLEPVDAVTQCEKALNGAMSPICYLCGQPMYDKTEFGTNYAHALYPECEHILPVTTARWYLTLYTGKYGLYAPGELELEYAWAHRVCNQTKSNELYIQETETQFLAIDADKLVESLQEIGRAAATYLSAAPPTMMKKYQETLSAIATLRNKKAARNQSASVQSEKLVPIVEFVNRQPRGRMTTLARVAGLMNTEDMVKDVKAVVDTYFKTHAKGEDKVADNVLPKVVAYSETEAKSDVLQNVLKTVVVSIKDDIVPRKTGDYGKDLHTFLTRSVRGFKSTAQIANRIQALNVSALDEDLAIQVERRLKTPLSAQDMFQLQRYYAMNLYILVLNTLIATVEVGKIPPPLLCTLNQDIQIAQSQTSSLGLSPRTPLDPRFVVQIETICKSFQQSERRAVQEGSPATKPYTEPEEFVPDSIETIVRTKAELSDRWDDTTTQLTTITNALLAGTLSNPRPQYSTLLAEFQTLNTSVSAFRDTIRTFAQSGTIPLSQSDSAYVNHVMTHILPMMARGIDAGIVFCTRVIAALETTMSPNESVVQAFNAWKQARKEVRLSGGRRTTRARLFRRTRRARRSGPSTKLQRRSFRKSRMGK